MRIAKDVATEAEAESEAGVRCAVERRGEVAEAVEPAA
jgi:hypothetical protein